MIISIVIILTLASFVTFDFFDNKKFKEVVDDIEKTKAVLNLEVKGEELKKKKLQEQTEQILKNHDVTQKEMKKSLERIVDRERIEKIIFEK